MDTRSNPNNLVDVIAKRVLSEEVRQRIKMLGDEMDQLFFLDEDKELAVDRKSLIRFVNNEWLVPPTLKDIMLAETSKHLGRRLKEVGNGHRITLWEVENYGLPMHRLSETDIRDWGITEHTSTEELAGILKTRFPAMPSFCSRIVHFRAPARYAVPTIRARQRRALLPRRGDHFCSDHPRAAATQHLKFNQR